MPIKFNQVILDKEERPKEKIQDNLKSEIKAGVKLLKIKKMIIDSIKN